MNLPVRDFNSLYKLQVKFLSWWPSLNLPFYLTGGTALGHFYLNHRNSEDLDFFVNNHPEFTSYISTLKFELEKQFNVNVQQSLFAEDFARIFITDQNLFLKLEFINDVTHYAGEPFSYQYGLIDNPLNILANKLSALVGRDEPKDVFDILRIAQSYSFSWKDVFYHTKQKAVINELDIVQRLSDFPVELMQSVNWTIQPLNLDEMQARLTMIADDFLLGKANSLGKLKIPIKEARPYNGS